MPLLNHSAVARAARVANIARRLDHLTLLAAIAMLALVALAAPSRAESRAQARTEAPAQPQQLKGHVPAAVSASRAVRELEPTRQLHLAIGLPLRNQSQLDELLAKISDPSSPEFKHYLTPQQFAAQFGPTEHDYQALIQFAQQNHLTVTATHSNRVLLDVAATSSEINQALHVRMMVYNHPVRGEFYAPDREPTLDLETPTLDISGLDNFAPPRPMNLQKSPTTLPTQTTNEPATVTPDATKPNVTGSGPGGYFIGKDFRAAYAPSVSLTGSGQTVGLLEFDGFFASDETANASQANMTAVPTQTVLLDGFNGSAGSDNIEVILDIMMAQYMAPGLSKIIVYEGQVPNDILNRMATDNLAQQLSSSWGFSGVNATTEQIFKQYIAQGQSLFQASGDNGSYSGGVMSPSDDPNLTVVGGSSLTTAGASGPWSSESAWSGSGGGVSTTYPIPSYQQGLSMTANHGSTTMRNIPDVALTADIQMFLIQSNGQAVSVGGTSAAAPLWAGFLALANQQAATNLKPRVGFLNPLIYTIGSGSNYSSDLHDIRTGSNGGYSSVSGYDLTTGWGSPAGQHLINDLTASATSAAPSFTLSASSSSLTIKPSTTGSATITVAAVNGFNSTVSLTLSGLPTGVTAVFNPAKTTTTTALTFTAAATVASGTYPITITGTAGSVTATATISLAVVTPSFTLSPSVSTLTVPRSASGTSIITVAAQGGFASPVSLTTTGLPSGVTATFSPASATTTSTLTLAASSTATAGTYTVTVNGTSGTLKASTTIALTVTAPGFTLTFAPSTLAVTKGSTASGTLTVAAQAGFNGAINITLSALPVGVAPTYTPATGSLGIAFAASSLATPGSYPITITGTSGALSAKAALTLTVVAPAGTYANLAPAYNVNALVNDGAPFSGTGIDGGLNGSPTAYSANLVGAQQTIAGTTFNFGPANQLDSVSSATITLPAGQFSTLKLLATAVNGNQLSQAFKVTYTDGSSTTFSQNLSDWFTPQGYSGESVAMAMAYRDNSAGQRDNRTFSLYEYAFALNSSKTVLSITLPKNRNVVALAATLSR